MNPELSKVPVFYHKYIKLVGSDDLVIAFKKHQEFISFLNDIKEHLWDFKYAPDKWSIKEVAQHIIDAERVFCYRALTFSRKDSGPLPGFDENKFTAHSNAGKRTKKDLMEELEAVQKASIYLFNSFDEEQLNNEGVANGNPIQVKAIGFIIVGHTLHHQNILRDRYLQ
jgi:hypothetical protein